MLSLRKVAVTGSLSCGKSSVCRFFRELGAYVVDADEIVHKLLIPTTDLGKRIIDLLGDDVVINEQFDRSRIAKKVFNNAQLLNSLEKLLHPAVRAEIDRQYQQVALQKQAPLFIAEIPLFFEISETGYDFTIVVLADKECCKERFTASTGQSGEEFDKRMSRQMDPEEKAEMADFVILNGPNMTKKELEAKTKEIFNELCRKTFEIWEFDKEPPRI
jgi:dephospho-CoA kinase